MAKIKKEQTVLKQVQQLIKDECANYFYRSDKVTSYCCKEWTNDLACVYFQTEPEFEHCTYFKNNVLPLSEVVETIYKTQMDISRDLTSEEQKEIKITCYFKIEDEEVLIDTINRTYLNDEYLSTIFN